MASNRRLRNVPVILGRCHEVKGRRCEKESTSVQIEDELEFECGCRIEEKDCSFKQKW